MMPPGQGRVHVSPAVVHQIEIRIGVVGRSFRNANQITLVGQGINLARRARSPLATPTSHLDDAAVRANG